MNAIFSHRTIRKYKNTPIDDSVLNKILEAAVRASNTGNMQIYSIVVTKDEDIKKQLWECHFKQQMVLDAPVILTFCADINRFNKWCEQSNTQAGFDNFLTFYTASIDALLAAQNASLEAENNGLGICYLGTATYMAHKIVDILKLPQGVVPVTAVVIGYPAEVPENLTDRLPLEAVVHHDTYKDYTPADIKNLYQEKEGLEFHKNLVKLNNVENLAQIFTNYRYKKADNLTFSKLYLETLEKQGFMNHQ